VGSIRNDRLGRIFQLVARVGVDPLFKRRIVSILAVHALASRCRTERPKEF
jgi:hypothetical protein